SLTASPNPIVVGDFVTLTANGVFDSDGTIASVTFGYEDGTFGDQVIGVDSDGSDGYTFVDNTFDIGAGRTYYAFATDDDGAFSNRVEVRLNTISEPTDAFQEVDGLVTIEATDATARTSAQGREWVDDTRPDAINGSFVFAPGEGVNTGGEATGPRLDYDIEFANSGTYYVWLRMTAEDFGSDSVHVGLNGQSVTTNTFGVSGGGDDVFTWTDASNSINRRLTVNVPAAGVHTLNIWMREDGVKVDEIRVARSESYDPQVASSPLSQLLDQAVSLAKPKVEALAATDALIDFVDGSDIWTEVDGTHWTAGYTAGIIFELADLLERRGDATAGTLRTAAVDQVDRVIYGSSQFEDVGHRMFPSVVELRDLRLSGELPGQLAPVLGKIESETNQRAAIWNEAAGAYPVLWRPKPGEVGVLVDQLYDIHLLQQRAEQTGDAVLLSRVQRHARLVADNQVRDDGSVAQFAYYDEQTGALVGEDTFQGLSPESAWSRGQAWAILGFAELARATTDATFASDMTAAAIETADFFIDRLPASGIPVWDFSATASDPVDTSAAAIASYALLSLSQVDGLTQMDVDRFTDAAASLLSVLATDYLVVSDRPGILAGGSGNVPNGVAVETSLVFGDYWFLRAVNAFEELA
ncbi:MAG: hypothetical protein AAF561_16430, partial [Planctomycetota bacterium]